MTKLDKFIFSYVDKAALPLIHKEGLYGGEALLKREDLLKEVAKIKHLSLNKLKDDLEKDVKDPFLRKSMLGPNVVFKLVPDLEILSKKHPLIKNKLIPIKINLSQLLKDYPHTKIYGMELKPFKKSLSLNDREHFLSKKELDKFLSMSADQLWSSYNDIEDRGLYAPDVPHASINIENGIIPPKYLQEIKLASLVNDLIKLSYKYEDMCFR